MLLVLNPYQLCSPGNDASNAKPKDFFAVGSLNAREVISRSGHFPFTKEASIQTHPKSRVRPLDVVQNLE